MPKTKRKSKSELRRLRVQCPACAVDKCVKHIDDAENKMMQAEPQHSRHRPSGYHTK